MMTLRRNLAWRYSLVVTVCLCLLAGLTYHEFVREPRMLRELGVQEPAEFHLAETAEVLLYGVVPAVFAFGWWFVRRSLRPVDQLVRAVERLEVTNLGERLPRSHNGDEVDRLTIAFNSLAARLEQSFQQVREFTLHASHELKTPLTVMRAELETALAETRNSQPIGHERMLSLLDEVERLTKIVDGLTLLTKAESGLVKLERQPVLVDELVRECFEDAQILGGPHGITVSLTACEPAVIYGDRHRLRQLLLNLSDNAVKHNYRGGSVSMALRKAVGVIEIQLSNTGAGIRPEMRTRVFDRFVRGDSTEAQSIEGCGLGLTIARWIVQAHSGTIEIASDPNGLTSVIVRFPAADVDGAKPA